MTEISEDEIWSRVKALEGRQLFTYVHKEPNTIEQVEDTGKPTDRVLVRERCTFPERQHIVAACQLLLQEGRLCRKTDLDWLADPRYKTSSIVFRIVGEIFSDRVKVDERPPETMVLATP